MCSDNTVLTFGTRMSDNLDVEADCRYNLETLSGFDFRNYRLKQFGFYVVPAYGACYIIFGVFTSC